MRFLVDTSILIDYLRGGSKWEHFLKRVPKNAELFLPTIVIFELFSGVSTKDPYKAKQIINFLGHFQKRDIDEEIVEQAGKLYRDISKDLEVPDYIIAASSLTVGGMLLTLNLKHFQQIPGLKLYFLE